MGINIKTNLYVRHHCEEFFLEKYTLSKVYLDNFKKVFLFKIFFTDNGIV